MSPFVVVPRVDDLWSLRGARRLKRKLPQALKRVFLDSEGRKSRRREIAAALQHACDVLSALLPEEDLDFFFWKTPESENSSS